jgi:transposase
MNADATSGIDVSAKTLDVSVLRADSEKRKRRKFSNDGQGHQQLIDWLRPFGVTRVVCEATGVYHLDIAFALTAAGIPLMVANPRQVRRFIEARARNTQTDVIDADELAEYARRMDFVPWKAPSINGFELHKLGRAIGQLTKRHTAMLNRLHAARASAHTPKSIVKSAEREVQFIERERVKLSKEALRLVKADPDLTRKFELLVSAPGIAEVSALAILAELIVLPPNLAGKAWVKYAGIDPMSKRSGTSVNTNAHISKRGNARLRGALYMPALTARQRDPHLRDFADRMIANHKQPIEAIVAVQRKLLLSIHAMFRTNQAWIPQPTPKTA